MKNIKTKIFNWINLKNQIEIWRNQGKKIVFTNGCFDILHLGHVEYLSKSKDLGDILIVGLNSDKSPYWLEKGKNRPINNEKARSVLIASLMFVDGVALFDDETPEKIIDYLKPDILIKGEDYKPEEVVGYDSVVANGGEVLTIELTEGYSTTNILNKL